MNSRTSDMSDILDFDMYIDSDIDLANHLIIPPRVSRDNVIDHYGRRLIEFCQSTSFVIGNSRLYNDLNIGDLTYYSPNGGSVVDYLLLHINEFKNISDFCILDPNEFSDHCGISFSLCGKKTKAGSGFVTHETETFLKWDETKITEFQQLLITEKNTFDSLTDKLLETNNNTINDTLDSFINTLRTCAHAIFGHERKICPEKNNITHTHKRKQPWFNHECYNARNQYKRDRNAFLRDKSNNNLKSAYLNSKSVYNRLKKIQKNKYKIKEKQDLKNLSKSHPKKFWKKVKNQYVKPPNSAIDLTIDSLFDHFKNLYNHNLGTDINENYEMTNDNDLDQSITLEEIENAVFSQKNNKSSGYDSLIAEVYKHSFHIISPFMHVLFNKIFETGIYPDSWGQGIIVPIFKGGDIEDTKNYRGITLINIIAKIYSQVLLNRLTKWAVKNNKIVDNQYGFQKGKSTIDCVFLLHAIIAKTLNSGKKLYCCFVDFEKCFDTLNRTYIFQKLINENVSTKFVNAVRSMYNSVIAAVRYKKSTSSFFESNIGAKQGDPSSSLLFLFFINDLINCINHNIEGIFTLEEIKIFVLLFADDAALFAHEPEALQSMLNDLSDYCHTWGLKVNTSKTKVMIFEAGRHTTYNFMYNNIILENVKTFKYLGINLFKNGHWQRTQKKLAKHSLYALHNLFIIFNQLEMTIPEKCKLFDSLVGSILNYGAEILGYNEGKDIELIHCKFIRKILNVRKSTNLDGLYGELGRHPMRIQRKIIIIKYWLKIISADNNLLIKQVYMSLKQDADNNLSYNGKNWAYQVKKILDEIGMSNIWSNQNTLGYDINLNSIKLRILDIYKQCWYANINNSSRLETYCVFKHDFGLEDYLSIVNINKYRIALTKFRISSHNLEIEIGRHLNIPREDRKCKQCNMNVLENEFHFLLVCPKYYNIRRQFLKPYFCSWPTLHKLEILLSSKNRKTLYNLSKFLYFAFKERTSNN